MSNEELMKPRYKVIGLYPKCGYEIGDILYADKKGTEWVRHKYGFYTNSVDCVAEYPHLFKKLEWWEDRKPEEMPEYVKGYNRVYKMVNWTHNTCGEYFDEVEQAPNRVMFEMKKILPATAADYEAYLQTLTVK